MKDFGVTKAEDLPRSVITFGDPDTWVLICKASNAGWMKSTKGMNVPGGVIIQVTTQQGDNVAEALTFVPDCRIKRTPEGLGELAQTYVGQA